MQMGGWADVPEWVLVHVPASRWRDTTQHSDEGYPVLAEAQTPPDRARPQDSVSGQRAAIWAIRDVSRRVGSGVTLTSGAGRVGVLEAREDKGRRIGSPGAEGRVWSRTASSAMS